MQIRSLVCPNIAPIKISALLSSEHRTLKLWGDEIFGRHALLSRGWGSRNKLSIEPPNSNVWRPGSTTQLCAFANRPVEVRPLPLQHFDRFGTNGIKKAPAHQAGAFLFTGPSIPLCNYSSVACVSTITSSTFLATGFLTFDGLLLPNEPLNLFPFAVFLSPLPIS